MLLRLRFAGVVLSLLVCWGVLVLYLEWSSPASLLRHYRSSTALRHGSASTSSPRANARPPTTSPPAVIGRSVSGGGGAAGGRDRAQVVVAGDSGSLGGLVAVVNSVLLHTSRPVAFHLLTSAEERPHLRMWIESTKLHAMSYSLLPAVSKSQLRLAKTLLPQLLPPSLDGPALYLDPDVIVQGDVWEMLGMPIGAVQAGAFSRDCTRRARGWMGPWDARLTAAGVDPASCPLATGAFVVNLGTWRALNMTERLRLWLDALGREPMVGPHAVLDDVDLVMWIVLHDRVSSLPPPWHLQHLGSEDNRHSKQFVERARLLRWSGRGKPWLPRAPHAELWERYFVPDPTGQFRPVRKRG